MDCTAIIDCLIVKEARSEGASAVDVANCALSKTESAAADRVGCTGVRSISGNNVQKAEFVTIGDEDVSLDAGCALNRGRTKTDELVVDGSVVSDFDDRIRSEGAFDDQICGIPEWAEEVESTGGASSIRLDDKDPLVDV